MSAVTMNPDPVIGDPVIVIDLRKWLRHFACADNRTRLVAWFLLLVLIAIATPTAPHWVGWVLDIFFGKLLGL